MQKELSGWKIVVIRWPARRAEWAAKAALDETEAGAWDGHFGKGLSLEYAKSVSVARRKAFAAIAAYEEKHHG